MNFTKQELDLLFEAVQKWEQDDPTGEIIGSMMGQAMMGDRPEVLSKFEKEMADRSAKRKEESRRRKERGVCLRAKLIALRDGLEADQFVNQGR